MVQSQDLLTQVRYRLRDNGEPQQSGYTPINLINNKPDKGHFWSDRLIYLCLDMAQNILFNQALKAKDEVVLNGLYSSLSITGITQVPADFGWYITGTVYPLGGYAENIARIYIGGESEQYRTVRHYAIYIIGDNITARWMNDYPANGRLAYWRRPTPITQAGQALSDWEDTIYNDWIVVQACVLLGMMETQTAREYKNLKVTQQKFIVSPKKFVNYIENREQIGEEYGSKERSKSDGDNRPNGR